MARRAARRERHPPNITIRDGYGQTETTCQFGNSPGQPVNAALHRVAMIRRRWHASTIAYATRRSAEGLSKRDILRCLKRYIAREIYHALLADHAARTHQSEAA